MFSTRSYGYSVAIRQGFPGMYIPRLGGVLGFKSGLLGKLQKAQTRSPLNSSYCREYTKMGLNSGFGISIICPGLLEILPRHVSLPCRTDHDGLCGKINPAQAVLLYPQSLG